MVATNVSNLISDLNPKEIYVIAPVMLAGSEARIQEHFPSSMVRKFNYLRFAVVSGADEAGVGEAEHKRYGLGDEREKNLIIPEIVRVRREKLVAI